MWGSFLFLILLKECLWPAASDQNQTPKNNKSNYIVIFPLFENTVFNFPNSQHDHLDSLQVHKPTFSQVALQVREQQSWKASPLCGKDQEVLKGKGKNSHPGFVHHVFIDVNQAIDGSLPKHKAQGETPGSDKHRSCSCRERKQDSHLPDLQRWQVREEVIPHEEAHEDPVIDAPFKIKSERQAGHGELSLQVLQHTEQKKELREHCTGLG